MNNCSSVCTDEIAGRARNDESKVRNDVPGHPGPDPGSGSSVWAIKLDALLNVIHCNTMSLPAVCVGADFEKAETSSYAPAFIESYSFC